MCEKCVARRKKMNEKPLGMVSVELAQAFEAFTKREKLGNLDREQKELDLKRAIILEEKTPEQATEEAHAFNEKQDKLNDAMKDDYKALWDRVHKEIPELDRDENYYIDSETGIIYEKKEDPGEQIARAFGEIFGL